MKHSPGFEKVVNMAREQIQETTVDAVQAKLDNKDFVLIDVREQSEWDNGHLPGAEHFSKGVIERDIETAHPNKQQKIILYCGGGYRSALAALNLKLMGYENVISMDGGIREWREKGYPLV